MHSVMIILSVSVSFSVHLSIGVSVSLCVSVSVFVSVCRYVCLYVCVSVQYVFALNWFVVGIPFPYHTWVTYEYFNISVKVSHNASHISWYVFTSHLGESQLGDTSTGRPHKMLHTLLWPFFNSCHLNLTKNAMFYDKIMGSCQTESTQHCKCTCLLAAVKAGRVHLCRVAGNTVWSHMASDVP